MKRFLLFVLLVIILISLSWFNKVMAQDLSQLSAQEKEALVKKYQQQIPRDKPETERYTTPPIFDSLSPLQRPRAAEKNPADPADRATHEKKSDSLTAKPAEADVLIPFEKLRPFGAELFDAPDEVIPPDEVAAADDYILGPGDQLVVQAWGRTEKEYQLTVDRDGRVFFPRAGNLTAAGLRVSEFRDRAASLLRGIYADIELSVSLGKIRSIRIFLTGEVKQPGAYTVSSLTSLFNALYLAGGPNERGSMRSIRLMRNGLAVAELDLYQFLLAGDNRSDIRLQSGDVIFVPVTGARAAIRGQIHRPAIYELKGAQSLRSLLVTAGNGTADAFLGRIMIERVAGNTGWEVLDADLATDSAAPGPHMHDGDRVTVFSIFQAKTNMVAAFGQVKHPGYFERNDSSTLADLIIRAGLQEYDVHRERANLFRRFPDWRTEVIPVNIDSVLSGSSNHNLCLQDRDSLHIYSIPDVSWEKTVHIDGEINRPGPYPYYDGMTVSDAIFLAGSFTRAASRLQAEIGRVAADGTVTLIYVSLANGEADQTVLMAEDRVYIRQIPQWQLHRTVALEGEVNYPGEYLLQGNTETLYQLLQRAGGFTPNAFPRGIVFERRSIGSSLTRLRVPSLLEKTNPIIRDSVGQLSRSQLFVYDSSSVNRIVINIDELITSHGERSDLTLQPGDRIFVPPIPSGISVLGAVSANGTITFRDRKRVSFYIKQAGDFTRHADKKGTNLIKANGAVYAGKDALSQHVDQGDIIVVPTRIASERDWTRTLTTIVSATTGLLTTALLINKL